MVDFVSIATGAAAIVGPFMPYLIALGKSTGKKLEDVIEEQGGNFVYERAKSIWEMINGRFKDDTVLMNTAQNAAAEPENEQWQEMFAQTLAMRLKDDPEFAKELQSGFGTEQAIQQIIAGKQSWIEKIDMAMAMAGTQIIRSGDDSVISGVTQTMGYSTPPSSSKPPSVDD